MRPTTGSLRKGKANSYFGSADEDRDSLVFLPPLIPHRFGKIVLHIYGVSFPRVVEDGC